MKRNDKLIAIANKALQGYNDIWYSKDERTIAESYNGKTAALSVSAAMIGLLPTLAIYYKDEATNNNRDKNRAYGRDILEVISKMFALDDKPKFADAKELLEHTLNESQLKVMQGDVIDYAIALKQVIRTYELVKKDE